ncbi:MAG: DNA repair protein RecN [Myxococcales bacterium]|nr:DNA repair protein RecN [Myxococcales bacterium]
MLTRLRLSNFAVIEEAEVSFGAGLTVLTGETGAGKSILIDALGLLVGARAEPEVIRAGADEAQVEALFEKVPELAARLGALGLPDDGDEVIVRRTVARSGRARAYVNGSLVTVSVLQRLMRGLVDIAGQHEHLALFDSAEHLALLDSLAPIGGEGQGEGKKTNYLSAWSELQSVESQLCALGGDEAQVASRLDFLKYQLEEIDRLAPTPGEDVSLEQERRRLSSSEKLRHAASAADELISGGESSGASAVGRARQLIAEAERLDPSLAKVQAALITAQEGLDEAARALSRYLGALESDPRRLEEVEERLDALRRLCRKHAAPLETVLDKRASLAAEAHELEHRAERRAELEGLRAAVRAKAVAAAAELSGARRRAAQKLEAAATAGLSRLALARARFEVRLIAAPLGPHGADAAEWLFSANLGEPPRPLAKVASGGEASRLMLALKSALAGSDACRCSVFDEADAGIGGAVADVVGRLIKELSAHRQVLCITHLPQVAAHADAHLRIEKAEAKGRTRSVVTVLEAGEPRTRELARMLSGVEVTREALGAAEALLRTAVRPTRLTRARPRAEARRSATTR